MIDSDTFSASVAKTVGQDTASRVKGINRTTRDAIGAAIARGYADGLSPAQIAEQLETLPAFNPSRAELVARTETMFAYNAAAIESYGEFGVQEVEAIDGDLDPECAARDGQTYSLEEASSIEDHPNGTLDWVPVIGREAARPPQSIAERERASIEANRAASDRAAARAPKPATPSQVINQGPPKPVSDAFDGIMGKVKSSSLAMRDKSYVAVVDKIDGALRTINKTFRDGNLPPMPSIGPIKYGNQALQGQYKFNLSGTKGPNSLEFRAKASMETVFHEMTHFIDQHGLGFNGSFASKWGWARVQGKLDELTGSLRTSINFSRGAGDLAEVARLEAQIAQIEARAAVMDPVARAIINSKGYQALIQAKRTGQVEYFEPLPGGGLSSQTLRLQTGQIKWASYATAPEEAFARAMGQYLTKRHTAEAVKELEGRIYFENSRAVRPMSDQWDWDDFQAIDDAITKMLDDLEWSV